MLVHQETGRDHKVSILFNYILQNIDDFCSYYLRAVDVTARLTLLTRVTNAVGSERLRRLLVVVVVGRTV